MRLLKDDGLPGSAGIDIGIFTEKVIYDIGFFLDTCIGAAMRVGMGYDIHRLTEGRPLVLGGVTVPFKKGLLGHSDADVVLHALCDALLGAVGLGDIGHHFPDTDPKFKGIFSMRLLKEVSNMLKKKGCIVINADITIMAEKPKLSPFRLAMQENIADALAVNMDQINIKATTTEGLGSIGRGEGIAAMCVVLVEEA